LVNDRIPNHHFDHSYSTLLYREFWPINIANSYKLTDFLNTKQKAACIDGSFHTNKRQLFSHDLHCLAASTHFFFLIRIMRFNLGSILADFSLFLHRNWTFFSEEDTIVWNRRRAAVTPERIGG
jgi:hypothetical protein